MLCPVDSARSTYNEMEQTDKRSRSSLTCQLAAQLRREVLTRGVVQVGRPVAGGGGGRLERQGAAAPQGQRAILQTGEGFL